MKEFLFIASIKFKFKMSGRLPVAILYGKSSKFKLIGEL